MKRIMFLSKEEIRLLRVMLEKERKLEKIEKWKSNEWLFKKGEKVMIGHYMSTLRLAEIVNVGEVEIMHGNCVRSYWVQPLMPDGSKANKKVVVVLNHEILPYREDENKEWPQLTDFIR